MFWLSSIHQDTSMNYAWIVDWIPEMGIFNLFECECLLNWLKVCWWTNLSLSYFWWLQADLFDVIKVHLALLTATVAVLSSETEYPLHIPKIHLSIVEKKEGLQDLKISCFIFRKFDCPLEVLRRDVQAWRLRSELPSRPGHHQPLQAPTRDQNDQERRARNSVLHKHCARSHLNIVFWVFIIAACAVAQHCLCYYYYKLQHNGQITVEKLGAPPPPPW